MSKQKEPIYKITFINKGQIYEVFAKQVYTSDLYGFVEIEDFLFGEKTQVVVDPSEEKLKAEFQDVKRSFIPMQAIIRIDEVEKEGISKIENGDNVAPFPTLISPHGSREENWQFPGINNRKLAERMFIKRCLFKGTFFLSARI